MIKFYHKQGCPICNVALAKLQKKNIEFQDILVDPNDEQDINFAYLRSLNVHQFPVLLQENGNIISGANVSKWANQQQGE